MDDVDRAAEQEVGAPAEPGQVTAPVSGPHSSHGVFTLLELVQEAAAPASSRESVPASATSSDQGSPRTPSSKQGGSIIDTPTSAEYEAENPLPSFDRVSLTESMAANSSFESYRGRVASVDGFVERMGEVYALVNGDTAHGMERSRCMAAVAVRVGGTVDLAVPTSTAMNGATLTVAQLLEAEGFGAWRYGADGGAAVDPHTTMLASIADIPTTLQLPVSLPATHLRQLSGRSTGSSSTSSRIGAAWGDAHPIEEVGLF